MELLNGKDTIDKTLVLLEGKMRSFVCSDDKDGFGWVILQPWNGYLDPKEEAELEVGKPVKVSDQSGLVIVSTDVDAIDFMIEALQEMKQVLVNKRPITVQLENLPEPENLPS